MRKLPLVLALLGVLSLAGAAAVGLTGIEIDVRDGSYDCGAAVARLGGDDREQDWALESLGINEGDEPDVPEADLPHVACKDATDDRLLPTYALVGLGLVLLAAAAVVALLVRRRRAAPRRPAPADAGSTTEAPPS